MLGIYKWSYDGCYGSIEGIILEDDYHISVAENTNVSVYFGEVLGKYSEVELVFNKGDFELISNDPDEVKILSKAQIGYNPFDMERFSFTNSDELEQLRQQLEQNSKYFTLGEFLDYIMEAGIYDNI